MWPAQPELVENRNAVFRDNSRGLQRFVAVATWLTLTVLGGGRSLVNAERSETQSSSAVMQVSVAVQARCDVQMRPRTETGDLLSSFDITCQGVPSIRIEKNPKLYTTADGRRYVVTTVLF